MTYIKLTLLVLKIFINIYESGIYKWDKLALSLFHDICKDNIVGG